jgi:hypothetical protein
VVGAPGFLCEPVEGKLRVSRAHISRKANRSFDGGQSVETCFSVLPRGEVYYEIIDGDFFRTTEGRTVSLEVFAESFFIEISR